MRRLRVTREETSLACQASRKEGNNTIQRKWYCGNNSGLSCRDYGMDSIQEIPFFDTKERTVLRLYERELSDKYNTRILVLITTLINMS